MAMQQWLDVDLPASSCGLFLKKDVMPKALYGCKVGHHNGGVLLGGR